MKRLTYRSNSSSTAELKLLVHAMAVTTRQRISSSRTPDTSLSTPVCPIWHVPPRAPRGSVPISTQLVRLSTRARVRFWIGIEQKPVISFVLVQISNLLELSLLPVFISTACDTFAGMGGACSEIDMFPNATVAEYGLIDDGDIHKIMAEIYARGPVAAVINAEPIVDYAGGVFKDKSASKDTNHIVSIVGVSDERTHTYNIVFVSSVT